MHKVKAWIIASNQATADQFAKRILSLKTDEYKWVIGPKTLEGLRNPLIFILPNWWRIRS